MLFDQIPQQCPERLALLVFRQHPGNVTRNRIGSSGPDLPVDTRQLILGQTDSDLRPGSHTSIIPLVNGSNKLSACDSRAECKRLDPQNGRRSPSPPPCLSAFFQNSGMVSP